MRELRRAKVELAKGWAVAVCNLLVFSKHISDPADYSSTSSLIFEFPISAELRSCLRYVNNRSAG
ncbi:MAG: hypothetical protein MI923_28885 [Phycisphaerales bacterium]|nr:hypothetical protein [Phycisphaerales bacterium]